MQQTESQIRLCWLLEDAPAHFAATLGGTVTSAALLPELIRRAPGVDAAILAQLAARMLQAAPAGEVHLPYLSRRDWKQRGEILAGTEFTRRGTRLLPSAYAANPAELLRYEARLFSAAAFYPASGATLEFVDGPLSTSVSASAAPAWRFAPPERSAAYFRVHAPVSVAIQRTIRRAARHRWLSRLENCSRIEATCTLLAYSASAPFNGDPGNEFARDILKSRWFRSAFVFARAPLAAMLADVAHILDRAGYTELARQYRQFDAKDVLATLDRHRGPLQNLFANEARIVYKFLSFGSAVRNTASPRPLALLTLNLQHDLLPRLRRFCRHNFDDIFPLLLIEATAALARHAYPRSAWELEDAA